MSETTATILKFAAAIILAISLIAISINVYTPGADSAKAVTTDFTQATTELQDQKYLIYDNTQVSGSQVINALRKFEAKAKDGELGLYVQTGKNNAGGAWYFASFANGTTVSTTGAAASIANTTNVTSSEYVNPAGLFEATVHRDQNGVIRAIKFVQSVSN